MTWWKGLANGVQVLKLERRMTPKRGPQLLSEEIERRGITCTKAAEELRATKGAISVWLSERFVPKSAMQLVIEIWSGGRVPWASWLTPEEKKLISLAKKEAVLKMRLEKGQR